MTPCAPQLGDVHVSIAEFAADATRLSLELPHMTTGHRKQTKILLESYPELKCESYGLGQERRLHLFKVAVGSPAIDDLVPMEAVKESSKHSVSEAAPAQNVVAAAAPSKNAVQGVMGRPVSKLELGSIKEGADEWEHASFTDGSTTSPSPCRSDSSPPLTSRSDLPPWFRLPPGLELEVQNTFIHFKNPSTSQRAVQSMPHNMFRQCLFAEALKKQYEREEELERTQISEIVDKSAAPSTDALLTEGRDENSCLTIGTEVVIVGLSKFPAFNGVRGMLQSLDEQSGRFNILLSSPVGGHKLAKVKRENIHLLAFSESLHLLPEHVATPRHLQLTALV